MRRDPDHAELERFLAEHGEYLLHIAIAIALTGSRADGEDLFQAALERLLPRWRTIASDAAASYLRRTLYNLAADGWRRRGAWRRAVPLLRTQDAAPGSDAMAEVDLRDALVRLLAQLPPRQRAGHRAAVLGAAHRGRDGRPARLLSGHGQVGHLPSAATAP